METPIKIDPHVHLYFENGRYTPEDVILMMEKKGLNAVCAIKLNRPYFQELNEELKKLDSGKFEVQGDSRLIQVTGEKISPKYFLRGIEAETQITKGYPLHITVMGTEKITSGQAIEYMINQGLKQGAFVSLDHIAVDNNRLERLVSPEIMQKIKEVCIKCNSRPNPEEHIGLEYNGYCNTFLRNLARLLLTGKIGGNDANQAVLELHENLIKKEGVYVPIVPGTDLHARFGYVDFGGIKVIDRLRRGLQSIGTSNLEFLADVSSGEAFVKSMKQKVCTGEYMPIMDTVGPVHFFWNYGAPILADISPEYLKKVFHFFEEEGLLELEHPRS